MKEEEVFFKYFFDADGEVDEIKVECPFCKFENLLFKATKEMCWLEDKYYGGEKICQSKKCHKTFIALNRDNLINF